jgi:hypothetical protein
MKPPEPAIFSVGRFLIIDLVSFIDLNLFYIFIS